MQTNILMWYLFYTGYFIISLSNFNQNHSCLQNIRRIHLKYLNLSNHLKSIITIFILGFKKERSLFFCVKSWRQIFYHQIYLFIIIYFIFLELKWFSFHNSFFYAYTNTCMWLSFISLCVLYTNTITRLCKLTKKDI